jgi:hypothetical protein
MAHPISQRREHNPPHLSGPAPAPSALCVLRFHQNLSVPQVRVRPLDANLGLQRYRPSPL